MELDELKQAIWDRINVMEDVSDYEITEALLDIIKHLGERTCNKMKK